MGIILDDDGEDRPALFVEDVELVEGSTGSQTAVFDVRLSRPFANLVSVPYETKANTAGAGSDFTAESGTLNFTAGQTQASVSVDITTDTQIEATEQFDLVLDTSGLDLSNGSTAAVGTATILDDDAGGGSLPVLSVSDARQFEGTGGDQFLQFDVTLSAPSSTTVFFDAKTVNGTAFRAFDFDEFLQTFSFAPGETTNTLFIRTQGFNSTPEGDESLFLEITNVEQAVIEGGRLSTQGLGVILDDDGENRPALFVEDVELVEGNAGTQSAVFNVHLSRPFDSAVSIPFETIGNTAEAGSDFTATSGMLSFAPGQTAASVSVAVSTDTEIEATERFDLVLDTSGLDLSNGSIAAVGTATLFDNDAGGGARPVLSISDARQFEGTGGDQFLQFDVTLSAPSSTTVSFDARTINGTAFRAFDFDEYLQPFSFDPGETTKTLSIRTQGFNSTPEGDESVLLEITNVEQAVIEGGRLSTQGLGVILDDDGENRPALFVEDVELVEGNAGTQSAVFNVHLSRPFDSAVSIPFETIGNTAEAGSDFTAASGTLSFAPGQTAASLSVAVSTDTEIEATEQFDLVLNTSGLDLSNGSIAAVGTATIFDDDAGGGTNPVLSISDARQVEGTGGDQFLQFDVTLSAPSSTTVSFDARTINGTAFRAFDFDEYLQTFSFAPGETAQTLSIRTQGFNSTPEGDESVFLEITNVEQAAIEDGRLSTRGLGFILDDDGENRPALSVEDVEVREGSTGTREVQVPIALSRPLDEPLTVRATTSLSGSADADDIEGVTEVLTFAPGQTRSNLTFTIESDTDVEPTEIVYVVVSGSDRALLSDGAAGARGVVHILDDDAGGGSLPVISVRDAAQFEGTGGDQFLAFDVSLSGPASTTVGFRARTIDGTAQDDLNDYDAFDTDFEISPGDTSLTIFVRTEGFDDTPEGNENLFLELSNASGAVFAGGGNSLQAEGTILDDDTTPITQGLPSISVADIDIQEPASGMATAQFTLTVNFPAGLNITGDFEVVEGTAQAGQDFTAASGSFTIPNGSTSTTVSVPVLADMIDEAEETFVLRLSNVTNAQFGNAAEELFAIGSIADAEDGPLEPPPPPEPVSYHIMTGPEFTATVATEIIDAPGANQIGLATGASAEVQAAAGGNTFVLPGPAEDFTIALDIGTVILSGDNGERLSFSARSTPQTLVFDDGALDVQIAGDSVLAGSQILDEFLAPLAGPLNDSPLPLSMGGFEPTEGDLLFG